MTDTAPLEACSHWHECRDYVQRIPAMDDTLEEIRAALLGDLRTGTPGLLEGHREHDKRIGFLEERAERQSSRIHRLETAGGATAKRALWETMKIAGVAVAGWFAGHAVHPPH